MDRELHMYRGTMFMEDQLKFMGGSSPSQWFIALNLGVVQGSTVITVSIFNPRISFEKGNRFFLWSLLIKFEFFL